MKVAIVTGAASGIGQALAVAYAKSGVAVVGGFFPGDPHDPASTERAVREANGQCVMQPVDVTSAEQVDAFAQTALERFGRIDYAVANAGLLRAAPLTEMRDEQWHEMLDVDLSGVMRTFRAAAGHMTDGGALVADGAPMDVLTPERLASVYGVAARIDVSDGLPLIVPTTRI